MVLAERSYHRDYSCEISNSSTHCSKVITKVKVSERKTVDRMTDRTKTIEYIALQYM